ncbi:hypothetical protein GUITHDRAFT_47598, partial [Guillardia theta CCMP2712]
TGRFTDGVMEGVGTAIWPDGSSYHGDPHEHRHGHGTYRWPDGSSYEGDYVHDQRHGEGAAPRQAATPSRDERRSGQGLYRARSWQYSGSWREDMMDGEVT